MRGKGEEPLQIGKVPPLLHKRSQVLQKKFKANVQPPQKEAAQMRLAELAFKAFDKALETWQPLNINDQLFDLTLQALRDTNPGTKQELPAFNYIKELLQETALSHTRLHYSALRAEKKKEVADLVLKMLQEDMHLDQNGSVMI